MGLEAMQIASIRASAGVVQAAISAGDQGALQTALTDMSTHLGELDAACPDQPNVKPLVDRLLSGRSRVRKGEVRQMLGLLGTVIDSYEQARPTESAANKRPSSSSSPLLTRARHIIPPTGKSYTPRPKQAKVARKATDHFMVQNRGVFRLDTGEGKTPTYAFIIRDLRSFLPEFFRDAVIVMQSNRQEPALKMARTVRDILPGDTVAMIDGGLREKDMEGVTIAVGTYSQMAQEGTSELLQKWAGERPVLFVLDETDLVIFKGETPSGERTSNWMQLLIDFGIFDKKGHYRKNTTHWLLGGSATLDRPDGRFLSTFWGPGNCFFHAPMAQGVLDKTLVPVVGKVLEMDVPPAQAHLFRDFTIVKDDGTVVVNKKKVTDAAGSDFAIKTSVRAMLDHMLMQIGPDKKGKAVRIGFGFATGKTTLEKHMRWQQELFDLVEQVFRIYNGLASSRPMRVEGVLEVLGGKNRLDEFQAQLERFLYSREWRVLEKLWKRARSSLENRSLSGVQELFNALYTALNVEIRRIQGRPLVATAVWEDMDNDDQGHLVQSVQPAGYPNNDFRNRFGGRPQTMEGLTEGKIDVLWSIGIIDRGFDLPRASLIVDAAPNDSRRMIVQRAGRIMRPWDPSNPYDHTKKPEALYVTITPNLQAHRLDLSVQDLARAFGSEMDPETNMLHLKPGTVGPGLWRTPDTVQLDLGGGKKVHLIRVGYRMVAALVKHLKQQYGTEDYNPELFAFNAGASLEDIEDLLKGIRPIKESKLRQYMQSWGFGAEAMADVLRAFHSDLAEMKTVYGNAWRMMQS